jgi:hypothetical protein
MFEGCSFFVRQGRSPPIKKTIIQEVSDTIIAVRKCIYKAGMKPRWTYLFL